MKHRYAKDTVARWLREDATDWEARLKLDDNAEANHFSCYFLHWGPRMPHTNGIFTEYPICIDAQNRLHGWPKPWFFDPQFKQQIPTYQECVDAELLPLVIFDVVYVDPGRCLSAFEIVHTHGLTDAKIAYLKRIATESATKHPYGDYRLAMEVLVLDAAWVLQQPKAPAQFTLIGHRLYR